MAFVLLIIFSSKSALADNEKKVALVMKALSNPFFSKMESGARDYSKKHGIALEVFGVERETEVEKQIGIVENLISRDYGAIVIAPADSRKLAYVCKKAVEKGITVINIDNPLHKQTMQELDLNIPFVGSDNYVGASLVGRYVGRRLNGKGKVVIIEGIRGVENADLRKKGFIDALEEKSGVEIVASESANWHTDEALSLATAILKKYGEIDAFLCANDKMALGVLSALELQDDRGDIIVTGYDNIDAVRYEMRRSRIHATVEQHPELMGAYGVELAWKGINGEKTPRQVGTPIDLVTHESFDKYIVFSVCELTNPFFATMKNAALKTGELFGIDVEFVDAENDNAKQLTDIVRALASGADALMLNPTNSETVTPGIEAAVQRGIPVITVDRKAASSLVLSHVAPDNIEGGRQAAKLMARYLGGVGCIVELEGRPGTSAAHERGRGFNEIIDNIGGLEVVERLTANFDRKQAKSAMTSFIGKGVRFDGVFAHNDNMMLGAIEAMEEARILEGKVLIGFDGLEKAVRLVENGTLTATIAQQPDLMGERSVKAAAAFFRGETVPGYLPIDLKIIEKRGE